MVNYTSIAPQSSGYEEQLNKQYGYWSDSLLLSDPKPHFGGSGSASQTSEVLPAANKAGATTLFTGSGGALAHTDDHGVDLVSSYSVTKSNISFKSDQAFTWSMEYLLETDGGGAKSGSAESRIYIIDTNASKVVHEFGGFFDIQDQMPSMNWNGTASGSLPPGSYRLCIMAIANVNKNQEAGGAGLTTAKAYWKADFSVKTYPPYHFKQYERVSGTFGSRYRLRGCPRESGTNATGSSCRRQSRWTSRCRRCHRKP